MMRQTLMKQTLGSIAGGILLLLFAYVHFTGGRGEPAVAREAPIVNDSTRRGQEPWMANEHHFAETRKHARKGALQGLDQAWAAYCGEGRSKLISGLNYYFERRGAEQRNPPKAWGESWARHVKTAWATADDSRIERLAQAAYGRGYFTLNDLRPGNRAAAGDVLGKERVTGKGCQ
jgi:hypothetical protein